MIDDNHLNMTSCPHSHHVHDSHTLLHTLIHYSLKDNNNADAFQIALKYFHDFGSFSLLQAAEK